MKTYVHFQEVCSDPMTVERQLAKACKQLYVTEVNIELFQRMIKSNVATNDVRNFAFKQQNLNRQASKSAKILSRVAMRQKLRDAYSTARCLKERKKMLKESLSTEHNYSKSKIKRVMKRIKNIAKNYRIQQKTKVKTKYIRLCRIVLHPSLKVHCQPTLHQPACRVGVWI